MLNQETKRKIDSARQILVGKVPDPKAQVEQITTALIYKFMDDMDKEAQELGGKARFFTNGYEKYAWTKLMDTKLGGQDRLNLYIEAITSLSQNPHIPQLFRDIFKDTFLPYRNPETLSLFLKEVNGFSYDNSEDLGNAFEYLLSILGSQGDAGQFRTPRHIIDFIVAVVNPKKDETICDPACGTAGFLISAYKHILKQHDGLDDPENKEKPLTPDERKTLMDHFAGYDISPDMVRLSKVNLYLHGFPSPTIFEYDTLSSEEKWDESFDVMLANPPFMSPKGGINPHKRFSINSTRAEFLFVDYILNHLNIRGRAGIIVPDGVLFKADNAAKQLRKKLLENNLYAIISLPSGVFQPYSATIKTSILIIDKEKSKKMDSILFAKVDSDGFSLGANRKQISKNDLPQILSKIKSLSEGKATKDVVLEVKNKIEFFLRAGRSPKGKHVFHITYRSLVSR
ncbi:MAG: N-6 DNA methylase [bacterium]